MGASAGFGGDGLWFEEEGFSLDLSGLGCTREDLAKLRGGLSAALSDMSALENGAIANEDEGRQVGHYWLRDPVRAPTFEQRDEIQAVKSEVIDFAEGVISGRVKGPNGPFRRVLALGIGGSALGPQFVSDALAGHDAPLAIDFLDNTDPDGFDRVLTRIRDDLSATLVLVISKSGGTAETRNALVEVEAELSRLGLTLPGQAVAITGHGSALAERAEGEKWLDAFPMWDWIGGRTSETSVVGLLPAALQGIDVLDLLDGARWMDGLTRRDDLTQNPAALMAFAWWHATGGRGEKDMVVLPYKDRLLLFSRYLQQLIMESLGKRSDKAGNVVEQGLTVYGNKGSTDQHAYVQQLRDGVRNFFVTFVEVLKDREGTSLEVEPGMTSGDYLHGFLHGTRAALSEQGRPHLTVTVPEVSAKTVGMLIALFERTVGLYASLTGINAYHQPGVEAGKKAAGAILALKQPLLTELQRVSEGTVAALAATLETSVETTFYLLRHLAANDRRVQRGARSGSPSTHTFRFRG